MGGYVPTWASWVEDLVTGAINRNLWRVKPDCDYDDLYQEAQLIFIKCSNKYIFTSPQHFNYLFSKQLQQQYHKLAEKRTKTKHIQFSEYVAGKEPGGYMYDGFHAFVDGENQYQVSGQIPTLDDFEFKDFLSDVPLDYKLVFESLLGEDSLTFKMTIDEIRKTRPKDELKVAGFNLPYADIADRMGRYLTGNTIKHDFSCI